jgi:FkbM family methyltransferase
MLDLFPWLFKGSEGVVTSDKILLIFIKLIYLSLRILLRLALGKKRRDKLYVEKSLDFGVFWNVFYRFFRSKSNDGSTLLRFKMPKYNFEFYCRNNKDDFKIMTIHEQDIIDRFIPNERDIVVDVGAHIGLYTIIASKRVGPNGKVIAIEADPSNFEMLNRNIQLNNLTNVLALNYAVYSKEEKNMKLYLPSKGGKERTAKQRSGFTKYNTVMLNFVKQNEKFIEVNANTLDNILSESKIHLEQVNWIKIDVEGAEFEVLKGAHEILSKAKDIRILMEVHGPPYDYKPKIEEFTELYSFKTEFERTYIENGSMHIVLRKL